MNGSYIGYMARNSAWLAEQDAKTTRDVYEMAQTLLQQGVTVSHGAVQVTGVAYTPGTREVTIYCNGVNVVLKHDSMGFYELQSQVRRLAQEGDNNEH